jgi:16S rRNA (guanine966-N2)-methyltransferase
MRIIGGSLRGRDLGAVARGVRPTSDRIRESLFSSLGDLAGRTVLDLFAGTGALGLEALSRGARHVVFVEQARRVVRDLQRRLAQLDLADDERIRVLPLDALRALRRLSGEGMVFDLVFVDPPYAGEIRETVVEALFASSIVSADATVVVEGPKRHPVPPLPGVRRLEERYYGDTLLTWLARADRALE